MVVACEIFIRDGPPFLVRTVEAEEQEKGFLTARLNEVDCPIGQDRGAVRSDGQGFLKSLLQIPVDQIWDLPSPIEMLAQCDVAIALGVIEAKLLRIILLAVTEMPFVDESGRIAYAFQHGSDRCPHELDYHRECNPGFPVGGLYCPVSTMARDGEQTGFVNACVNRIP